MRADWKTEVLILGGGPAGWAAGVAAARNGVRALIVEKSNHLGGQLTNAFVTAHYAVAGVGGGLVAEFWKRMREAGGAQEYPRGPKFNAAVARIVIFDLVERAGAEMILHAMSEEAVVEGGAVTGVYCACKGGRRLMRGDVVIDATGDGDVAASAGVPFEKGDAQGRMQAVSLHYEIAGVTPERWPTPAAFEEMTAAAISSGEFHFAPHVARMPGHWLTPAACAEGRMRFSVDEATGIDGSDAESLTRGEVECHRRVWRFWQFLQRRVPGFEKSRLASFAFHLGVRETRRILGQYVLTEDDVRLGRTFADGICRSSNYMDLHDGQEHTPEHKRMMSPPPGKYYEVPYRCLVPRGIERLVAAGRCISTTRAAHGSIRLQPTCMNTGQAAGTAAALCVRRGVAPSALDGVEVRQILRQQGMEI